MVLVLGHKVLVFIGLGLETLSLGLVLGLETQSLGLGLGLVDPSLDYITGCS